MIDTADKNWQELSRQVADLQVGAFLRVVCQIGEVLEKTGNSGAGNFPGPNRGAIAAGKSTGTIENIVTSVTDKNRPRRIFSPEQK
jgi:hypothetical protein